MIEMEQALSAVRRVRRDDDVVITTMAAARVWMEGGSHPLDFVFVPSCMGHATSIGLGIALWRYGSKRDEKERAVYSHGNNRLEIVWTIVTAAVFVSLGSAFFL